MRVLDFFIGNHFFYFPLTEIARESEISHNSLKTILPKLLKRKILVESRKVRKSVYYKFNLENEFVKNIIKVSWQLAKQDILKTKQKIYSNKKIKVS